MFATSLQRLTRSFPVNLLRLNFCKPISRQHPHHQNNKTHFPSMAWQPNEKYLGQSVRSLAQFVNGQTKSFDDYNRFKIDKKYSEIETYIEQRVLGRLQELKSGELVSLLVIVSKMKLAAERFLPAVLAEVEMRDPKEYSRYEIYYIMKSSLENLRYVQWKMTMNKVIELLEIQFDILDMNFHFSFLEILGGVKKRFIPVDVEAKLKNLITRICNKTLHYLKEIPESKMDIELKKVLYRPAFIMQLLKQAPLTGENNTELYNELEKVIIYIIDGCLNKKQMAYKTWVIFYAAFAKTTNGGQKLLEFGWKLFQKQEVFKQGLINNVQEHMIYVITRHINFEIFKIYQKLQFKTVDNIQILMKCEIPKPSLHPLIKTMIESCKFSDPGFQILPVLYPEHFKQMKLPDSKQSISNEFSNRVLKSLSELGINYKTEVFIAGRFCDILIDDEIIVEVDGDVHLEGNVETFRTVVRNFLILFKGKKLLVVKLDEYHHSGRDLKDILKTRLAMFKENKDIVMIA